MALSNCLTCLTLLLLLLLVLPAAGGTITPRLPADLYDWVTASVTKGARAKQGGNVPLAKFWDREALLQANTVNNLEQARPLLEKLNSGQPITVVALGDSITANLGGFFHRHNAHRAQHVQIAWDHLSVYFHSQSSTPSPAGAWLATFMKQVNKTWPHPDHLLINLGRPGSNFHYYAEGGCLEEFLPRQADLLIHEHLPYLEAKHRTVLEAERLLHRFQLFFQAPLPAVIILSMHLAVDEKEGVNATMEPCLRAAATRVNLHCQSQFELEPKPERLRSESEMATHAFASHHGLASISHPELINKLVRNGIAHRMTGMNALETFRALYSDRVHPNTQGRMLMADLLIDYLARAEVALAARPVQAGFAPKSGMAVPTSPLNAKSVMFFRSLCCLPRDPPNSATARIAASNNTTARSKIAQGAVASGATAGSVIGNNRAAASGGVVGGAHSSGVQAGEDATGHARQTAGTAVAAATAAGAVVGASITSVGALNIAKADGWQYVEIDGESQKHKPGWVATEPGSVLWIDLPLLLPSAPSNAPRANVEEPLGMQARVGDTLHVRVSYLKSYQHMGQAMVGATEPG